MEVDCLSFLFCLSFFNEKKHNDTFKKKNGFPKKTYKK